MFICHDHKMGYPTNQSINGHKNFMHKGEDIVFDEVDELPEGYAMTAGSKSKAAPPAAAAQTASQAARPAVTRVVEEPRPRPQSDPAAVVDPDTITIENVRDRDLQAEDPQAHALQEFLKGLGTPDTEVALIVNGFLKIDQFHHDPQALASWLQKNMRNRGNHDYIPTLVNQVLGIGGDSRSYIYPPKPEGGYAVPPGYNYNPWGQPPGQSFGGHGGQSFGGGGYYGYPPTYAQPAPPPVAQPAAAPTPAAAPVDTELKELLTTVNRRLDRMDEDRRTDAMEARHREDSLQHQRELDGLKSQIQQAVTSQKSEGGSNGPWEAVLKSLEGMQKKADDDRIDKLAGVIGTMAKVMTDEGKQEVVGRTTEDVITQIVPVALDKLSQGADRIMGEVASLREQVIPRASDAAEEDEELNFEEITELGAAEQEAIALRVEQLTPADMESARPAPEEGEEVSHEDEGGEDEGGEGEVDEGREITEDNGATAG
jgi:hypothetical protein